ncbi:MAG: peptidylprolyl isomerase [Prolixibacteraceae bacterium]|nr:peptidylprolyl isomerase [Prolixibacteraceae bacterium]
MHISTNKMVTLRYTLRSDNMGGDIIEQTTEESPLKFVFGLGMMLPAFETNLAGLKQGDDFEMTLKAGEAYGEVDETSIVDLPKNIFLVDGFFDEERFRPGIQVPMQTSSGQRMNGIVLEVNENEIRMDFNHPLAGIDLHFSGNIIEVREATKEELSPAGCEGCSSGDCGSHDAHDEGCCSGGCNC